MILNRLLLFALLTVCPAVANTILVSGVDSSLGLQQSLYIDENGTPTQIYWAGGIDITVDGYTRAVYCVELFTDIYLNTTYNTTMENPDTADLERVAWLLQNDSPAAPTYTGAALQTQGAGLQLAIWDIIENNGDGFGTATTTAGTVSQSTDPNNPTNPAVLLAAQQYEALSAGKSSTSGIVYVNVTVDGGTAVQNLMGTILEAHEDGGPSPAPEPGTVILMLGGLAMLVASRLRRRAGSR
jgi:hypothetical protein